MLIASIPFVRNLAEYSGSQPTFTKLTSLLHIKEDSSSITVKDLEALFQEVLIDSAELALNNPVKLVLDLIYETSDIILKGTDVVIELENKIVLAMAIRLKAEGYMIKKINDNDFWKSIENNQTMVLYKKYIELFGNETNEAKLLEDVNLMTPENIHLNSFMYEPILDMSNEHLKQLYTDISALR